MRSQQGFTPDSAPLIDSKLASELEKNLNLKSEYVAENATHYSIMWNDQHTTKIAQTIDNLVGQYDIHRKIEVRFDGLKEKEIKLDANAQDQQQAKPQEGKKQAKKEKAPKKQQQQE